MGDEFNFDENDDFSFDNLEETDSDEFSGFGGFTDNSQSGDELNSEFGNDQVGNEDTFGGGDDVNNAGSGSNYIDGSYTPDLGTGGANSFGDVIEPPSSKTKIFVIIGIGVALIVVSALLYRVANGIANKGSRVTMQETSSYDTSTNVIEVPKTVVTDTGWTEIEKSSLSKGDKLSGDFTVTEIKYYSKQSKLAEVELKTVVKGSISGLSGTYEIDIPYSNGVGLKVGDVFSIKYRLDSVNDCNIVYDITY